MKHTHEYRDAELSRKIIERIHKVAEAPVRLMEVCGTHTVSIFRNGIRSVLPENLSLISGPGCPVCVTDQSEIDACIDLAGQPDTTVATFGDLIRVPGSGSSLGRELAGGADVRVVYSALDAVNIAQKNPDKQVIFLGVGFETTAPTIAASIIAAREVGLSNYFVYSAHKQVPPALEALMETPDVHVDGFLLPGHVSVVIGEAAYRNFFERYRIPCVIAGFEPIDILQAILRLAEMLASGSPALENAYPRVVSKDGNPKAKQVMHEVFETCDTTWRGLGPIPASGLAIKMAYAPYNAARHFDLKRFDAKPPKGCACGQILTGKMIPPQCPLYGKACTPADPVGPCMVSSEGTCAAYYKYSK